MKIVDPVPPRVSNWITIGVDRVISRGILMKGEVVLRCSPVLTYEHGGKHNLPSLLREVEGTTLLRVVDSLQSLYPRVEEDRIDCLKKTQDTVSSAEECKIMVGKPEYLIGLYCDYNCFHRGNRRLLYVEGSKFNHSCEPNCSWNIVEDQLVVVTDELVLCDRELTINYIPGMRRNLLALRYFQCKCPRCIGKCNFCDQRIIGMLMCGKCKTTNYCSKECQRKDWGSHKSLCKKVAI
jgi:hypothetical protein